MVQPLGAGDGGAGGASAPGASAATLDPEAFNRFELEAWEAAAGSYGFLRELTARANGSLLSAAGVARGLQVLDVGSGPGDLAAAAAALGADTVGIDVAPSMVRRAALSNPTIPFRVGSFEAIPAGEGAFDAVVGGFVFNHVGSPEAALAEAHRVLRSGGRLALATWDAPSRNRVLGLFVDAVSAVGAPSPQGIPVGPTHFRSDEELRALFAAAGFDGVGLSRMMFEARVPDLDTLWDGVLGSGVRIPPTITRQSPAIRGAIRAAFDVLAAVHRRRDGYAIPVSMQVIEGASAVSGIRVAYTGEPGAFAEEAVLRFFAEPDALPMSSFRAVFEAVRDGAADAGVVPVESSLLGTIRENLDLLWAFDLPIAGEVTVPVRLALLALPGERLDTIERVYSISAALAQADEFLRSRPWSIQTTYNTAGAAKQIADRGERGAAAVASARVAAIYGLEVLADNIQTGDNNRTRFAVIARRGAELLVRAAAAPAAVAGAARTSLVFAVRNVAGSLHRSLGAFATRGLNLSRLESRPWTERGSRWEYLFWVDLDGDPASPACADALAALAEETEVVRILGTYPRAAEE